MSWKLSDTVDIEPSTKRTVESAAKLTEQNINRQREVIQELKKTMDLRKLLLLAELAGGAASHIHHWTVALLRFTKDAQNNKAITVYRLVKLARQMQDQDLHWTTLTIASKMVTAYEKPGSLDALDLLVSLQEKSYREFALQLNKTFEEQRVIQDDTLDIAEDLQEAAEKAQDEALALYMRLKPQEKIFHDKS